MNRSKGSWGTVLLIGVLSAAGARWIPACSRSGPRKGTAADASDRRGPAEPGQPQEPRVPGGAAKTPSEPRGSRPDADAEAKEAALMSDLQTLRSQIELYRVQHRDRCPGLDGRGQFDGRRFVQQMTRRTDVAGKVRPAEGEGRDWPYGPYLRRMPCNPFVGGAAASEVVGGRGPVPGDGTSGWYFETPTKKLSPNDPGHKDL